MVGVFYDHILDAVKQTGFSVEEILNKIKSAGAEGIEIGANELYGKEEAMKELFQKTDLKVLSIYQWFDFGNNGDPKPGFDLVDLANTMGAKKVLVVPGFIRMKWKWLRKMAMSNMAETLLKICEYGKEKGVMITMEDFDDWTAPFSKINELQWFLKRVPELKITFDTGNFLYNEEDELEAFHILKDSIEHVHLKDRSFQEVINEEYKSTILGRKMYSSYTGSGVIQIEKIIELLKKQNYTGDFTAEHFGSLHQLEDMERSIQWIKEHC